MDRGREILNLLLDRYERSGHCLPGKSSGRRVALSLARGEYAPYRENDPKAEEINRAVQALAREGLVSFAWRKGYEGWLLDRVTLALEALPQAYERAGRVPLADTAAVLERLLHQAAAGIQTPWKRRFLAEELDRLQDRLRPSRLLPREPEQAQAVLKVLEYTERGPELMRVISVHCFHNSKYLERHLIPQLAAIARAYEPELAAFRALDEELLPQSAVLSQLGILTYPEIFEFCGDVRLLFGDNALRTAPFQSGFCLQSENLEKMAGVDLGNVKTVLFVENRTNYRCLVLRGVPGEMLVVHHGGFYSPARRRFFRLLAQAAPAQARFWGDIDLGGFLMYTRLKRELFPGLVPWRMGMAEYEAHRRCGIKRRQAYLDALRQRLADGQFDTAFGPVAQAILKSGVTVEQELLL